MNKILIGLLFSLMVNIQAQAQSIQRSVQPTAGGTLTGGGSQLTFTIGETVIPTLAAGSSMITQGFQQPGEQLRTGTISGTSFCAGSTVSIPFNAVDIGGGNSFTAQLSDASGSFASPVNIGAVTGNAWGTIMATIPQNTATGAAYRIRIISSFPALTATDNSGSTAGHLVALSPNLWIGGNGNWSTPGNWCASVVPVSNANILINDGNPQLDVDFSVAGSLTLAGAGALTVLPLKTLDIPGGGNASLGGRPVTFKSDMTGYGSLGQVTGSLTGATNVTVERYLPNNGFRSWRLLSVPTWGSQTIRQAWQENNIPMVNNTPGFGTLITGGGNNTGVSQANGFDFSGANASMLFWNNGAWGNITSTLGLISARQAYFLFVRGDRSRTVTGLNTDAGATTLRTNGTAYTGNQSFTVPAGQFQLIPNLYPSAIDFTGLTRSGVSNNYTIWDSKTYLVTGTGTNSVSLGRYVTFSSTNDWLPSVSTVSYPATVPNTRIESGQAFFVQDDPLVSGGGTVTLREVAKLGPTGNGTLGLRPVNRAKLFTSLHSNGVTLDGNVVVFDPQFSNGVDGSDAGKMGNPGENFALETDQRLLSVMARTPVSADDTIRFRIWNMQPRAYELQLYGRNLGTAGLDAYLEDSYLQSSTAVNLKDTVRVSFTVNSDGASAAAHRFRLVFRQQAPVVQPAFSLYPNPVTQGRVSVRFIRQAAGRYQLRLLGSDGKTMLGRGVMHPGGTQEHPVELRSARLVSGNYLLEITGPGGKQRHTLPLVNLVP